MLSAQSTDARVNVVTPALFAAYPDAHALAAAAVQDVEAHVKTCGLYRTKAKNLVAMSKILVERFAGRVPRTMDELIALPGVGRKTANVVLSVAFDVPAIAVDTHVLRVANRLRLARAKTARETEAQLSKVIPRRLWSSAHHWLIHHGRRICTARRPQCTICVLMDLCPSAQHFLRLYARQNEKSQAVRQPALRST
jgi:endonuclease-3